MTVGTIERQGRPPMPTTSSMAGVRFFRKCGLSAYFLISAQKGHAVFEPGGLDQLQVLRILEHVRSLAA